jgi:hypothetical protein
VPNPKHLVLVLVLVMAFPPTLIVTAIKTLHIQIEELGWKCRTEIFKNDASFVFLSSSQETSSPFSTPPFTLIMVLAPSTSFVPRQLSPKPQPTQTSKPFILSQTSHHPLHTNAPTSSTSLSISRDQLRSMVRTKLNIAFKAFCS